MATSERSTRPRMRVRKYKRGGGEVGMVGMTKNTRKIEGVRAGGAGKASNVAKHCHESEE